MRVVHTLVPSIEGGLPAENFISASRGLRGDEGMVFPHLRPKNRIMGENLLLKTFPDGIMWSVGTPSFHGEHDHALLVTVLCS